MDNTELIDILYELAFSHLDEYGYLADDFHRLDYHAWMELHPALVLDSVASKQLYVLYVITPVEPTRQLPLQTRN